MKKFDLFVAVNLLLFLVLCVFRYYASFIEYRGIERHYTFDPVVLNFLQVGIVMHFCGAFVLIDGGRLYDASLLGVRYDKYVHFVNAFAATAVVARLFQIQHIPLTRANRLFVLLAVLGLGAAIEIVEYIAVLTVPRNGVGGYDNNMQDLIVNLCGASAFLMLGATLAASAGARVSADAAGALRKE